MASFEKDLFISYAHIDNQPLGPGEQGWITRFHASLETFLGMRLGQAAEANGLTALRCLDTIRVGTATTQLLA